MNTIKIYGASDDNVEVEGDVFGCDEYSAWDAPLWVELSTGDVFKVEYTKDGVWTVDHIRKTTKVKVVIEPYGEGEDPEPYTQTAVVTGKKIEWVETWEAWPPTNRCLYKKLADHFKVDVTDLPDLEVNDVRKVLEIVNIAKRRKS